MPHDPSTINAWTVAQQFNSAEPATSTQYNQLVNNVTLMYARPYIIVYNTSTQTLSNGGAIFTSGAPSTISNSPSLPAGAITFSTNTLTVNVSGLYRLTINASIGPNATASYVAMGCNIAGGLTANNHSFYTNRVYTSTTTQVWTNGSFILPMQAGGGTYPNTISFNLYSTASQSVQGATGALGASTTFVQLEYLGASTGSYH